jgi:hypothetical protein
MSLRSATSRRFTLMQDTLQRATDNSRALPLRCLTDGVDPCRFWSFFDRTFAALMRTFVLFACSIFLSSCSTPQVAMPSAVILSEDLHFEWVPPNLGHKMEIFISAGRYIRSAEDWTPFTMSRITAWPPESMRDNQQRRGKEGSVILRARDDTSSGNSHLLSTRKLLGF